MATECDHECDHEADALQHLQAANTAVTRLAGQLAATRDERDALAAMLDEMAAAIIMSDDPCPACGVTIAPGADHRETCPCASARFRPPSEGSADE